MLIERDLQVMNFDAVGEAYAIAANYLRRAGVLSSLLRQSLVQPRSNAERAALREYVCERFDWSSVSTDYVRMFETAAGSTKG